MMLPSKLIVVTPLLAMNPKSRHISFSLSDKSLITGTTTNRRQRNRHDIKQLDHMMYNVYLLQFPVNYVG